MAVKPNPLIKEKPETVVRCLKCNEVSGSVERWESFIKPHFYKCWEGVLNGRTVMGELFRWEPVYK